MSTSEAQAKLQEGQSSFFAEPQDLLRAILLFRETTEIAPTWAEGFLWLGAALLDDSRFPEAEENYFKAISLDAADSRPHLHLGGAYDYESVARRDEILGNIKSHINGAFDNNADPLGFLRTIGGVDAVRILTIHKCKGLEFHTVIVQGVETQTFWGNPRDTQCAFFVAISRARKRLITTTSDFREKLPGANHHWSEDRTPHQRFLGYVRPEIGGTP